MHKIGYLFLAGSAFLWACTDETPGDQLRQFVNPADAASESAETTTDNGPSPSDPPPVHTDEPTYTDVTPTENNPYPRLESALEPDIPNYGPVDNYCYVTQSCKNTGTACGYINDGCNSVLSCGGCAYGLGCINNQCVYPCDTATCPAGQYCQNTFYGPLCRCQPGFYLQEGECKKQTSATITLMAANITSGPQQTYCGPGIRIFKALKPDIAMVQEFSYDGEYDDDYGYTGLNEMVYRAFGPEYTYTVGRGAIPNGVVSRYPIVESGNWDDGNGDRDFQWAIIDIPGDRDLLAVSLHIKAGKNSSDKGARSSQIGKLLQAVKDKLGSDLGLYYLAIGGDFNLTDRNEYAFTRLEELFAINGPYPADHTGNDYSNANRQYPYDGIFVSPNLDQLEVPVIIGENTFENGLLFDSRVYTPLSDVAPVQAADSNTTDTNGDATNMQHMAVIKKYRLW